MREGDNGERLEPIEEAATIDVDEEYSALGSRKSPARAR